jgi:pyruvate dehydrogenase E2 component (dihydrolipoyllysine-residue acetyltransferase)
MNAAARLVEVRVPDMGNFKDVAIIDVLVKPGEKIEPEAPLVTLETEKATMDVPSTVGGVIEKIHITKGGTVSPGDLIVTVRSDDAAAGDSGGPAAEQQTPATAPSGTSASGAATAANAGSSASGAGGPGASGAAGSGASSAGGPGASGAAGSGASAAGAGAAATSSAAGRGGSSAAGGPGPTAAGASMGGGGFTPPGGPGQLGGAGNSGGAGASGQSGGAAAASAAQVAPGRTDLPPINEPGFSRAHAGPSVRKFARELGVDLTRVTGGGFKGRVTHDDVKAFVKKFLAGPGTAPPAAVPKKAPAPAAASALPAVPVIDFSLFGAIETRPLSRIQKISGPRLHASWVNIPHVTQFDEADITDLEELRGKLKQQASQANIKLTPLAFILRACVKALQAFPLFNSSLDATGANLVVKKYIHLGFAADTPNGLMVPVVHEADRKDVYEIARHLAQLSEKARAGKLGVADMQGGSFTISSLGGIGGTAFTPIINAPEVAILGVSRSAMRPIFHDGAFVPRLILPLSLSYDHRVIDGASAARFTTFLAQTLADPRGLTEAVP